MCFLSVQNDKVPLVSTKKKKKNYKNMRIILVELKVQQLKNILDKN